MNQPKLVMCHREYSHISNEKTYGNISQNFLLKPR